MSYRVFLTAHALRDLEEIDDYIVAADSPQNADRVLDQIERRFKSLGEFPERGTFPRELLKLGIRDFGRCITNPTGSSIVSRVATFTSCSSLTAAETCRASWAGVYCEPDGVL